MINIRLNKESRSLSIQDESSASVFYVDSKETVSFRSTVKLTKKVSANSICTNGTTSTTSSTNKTLRNQSRIKKSLSLSSSSGSATESLVVTPVLLKIQTPNNSHSHSNNSADDMGIVGNIVDENELKKDSASSCVQNIIKDYNFNGKLFNSFIMGHRHPDTKTNLKSASSSTVNEEEHHHNYTPSRNSGEFFSTRNIDYNNNKNIVADKYPTLLITYLCDKCGKCYPSYTKSNINQHNLRCHSSCNSNNSSNISRSNKRKAESKLSTLYTCKLCGMQTKYHENFRRHVLNTHATEKKYICDICGKRFKSAHQLSSHKRDCHSAVSARTCKFCKKVFKRMRTVTRHFCVENPKSKDMKKFMCAWCGMAYITRDRLTVHERKHTGIYPYNCSICNKGLLSPFDLKQHLMKVHHTTVLPP